LLRPAKGCLGFGHNRTLARRQVIYWRVLKASGGCQIRRAGIPGGSPRLSAGWRTEERP
jgi:hypothetical protein